MARRAVPQWGAWNPARVLPEVLMPLVTLISKSSLDVFMQNHFAAISLGYAITLSAFIATMVCFLYRLLEKSNSRLVLLLYFLICHFWIYRTGASGNVYMFYTVNATCVFFYIIPNLLNCILVLWIMQLQMSGEAISKAFWQMSATKKSAFVFFVYFAIFSNLWASILLAVYVSVAALFDAIQLLIKKKFVFSTYLKTHLLEISIVLLWAVQQVFELNGGRALAQTTSAPYGSRLLETLHSCLNMIRGMNKHFLLVSIGIFIAGVVVIVMRRDQQDARKLLVLGCTFLIVGLYLILSCAFTEPGYISRPDVQYCVFFLAMLILLTCADTLLRCWYPAVKMGFPLLLAVAVCNCYTIGRTYLDSTSSLYSPAACMRVCNDIMQQFLDAEAAGKTQLVLELPDFQTSNGWPLTDGTGDRFSNHFYRLGVTENYIEVTEMRYTLEKNAELHIAEESKEDA